MAYKNKKQNKKRVNALNKDYNNWRNIGRRSRQLSKQIKACRAYGLTDEQMKPFLPFERDIKL
jgi:hypothetical protein